MQIALISNIPSTKQIITIVILVVIKNYYLNNNPNNIPNAIKLPMEEYSKQILTLFFNFKVY